MKRTQAYTRLSVWYAAAGFFCGNSGRLSAALCILPLKNHFSDYLFNK
ncbi:MAG: hypothetical protein QM654_09830 [Dysgonamonadaceae bacterium]